MTTPPTTPAPTPKTLYPYRIQLIVECLERLDRERDEALAENKRLREALEEIAKYGSDGICPYGCDTPHIARAALKEGGGV